MDYARVTKPALIACAETEAKEIPFEEKRVDLEDMYLDEVKELGYLSLPVIADSTGNHFNGYVPEKMEALVEAWQA